MGYLLVKDDDWNQALEEHRAETPLVALRTLTRYLRERGKVRMRGDAGEHVSPQQLLTDANRQAGDRAAQRELAEALADLVETTLYPWDDVVRIEHPPDSYWRRAGADWVLQFRQPPPQPVLDELARRHPQPRCGLLLRGAEEQLAELRRIQRRESAPAAIRSTPVQPPERRYGRQP